MNEERWSESPKYKRLANSLTNAKILDAQVVEPSRSVCTLNLTLEDGRTIEIGVCGNLYDEAYFFFKES